MATPQNPREEEIEEAEEEQKVEDEKNENKTTAPPSSASNSTSTSAFTFWFYATALVTILAVLLSALHSLRHPTTQESWFLSLPPNVHHHYSSGVFVKTQLSPNRSLTQVFTIDRRPKDADTAGETVLLVHGLGCASFSFRHVVEFLVAGGFRTVAVDMPGSGFSDLMEGGKGRKVGAVLGKVLRVYKDVKEKGLFWGFDHLVEMGYVPYGEEEEEEEEEEEQRRWVSDETRSDDELGMILGQVIDSLGLAPLHVVAHDSAIGAVAKLVSEAEAGLVRSVTVVDSVSGSSAFPSWVLGVPLMGEVVLRSRWAFAGLLRVCCSRSIDESAAEAYRVMLKREGRRSAVVDAGKSLNDGFDFGRWSGSDEVKDLPVQILWSHMTSDLWIEEGKRVAAAVPRAKFVQHFGGRWPQEGAAEEIAGKIAAFVSYLPASHKQESVEDEQEDMAAEEANLDGEHQQRHEYAAGYMDAYGAGHAWGS